MNGTKDRPKYDPLIMGHKNLSLQSQFEYELGSLVVNPNAILLADINDDNENEIIVGTDSGEIFVYKGLNSKPWIKSSKRINSIISLHYEDISNQSFKYLVVVDNIGYIYLFTICNMRKRYTSDLPTGKTQMIDSKLELRCVYEKKLLANPKITAFNDSYFGAKEFVILDSSNKLSFYKWHKVFSNVSLSSENMSDYAYEEGGDFLLENVWYFDDEISSLSIIKNQTKENYFILTTSNGKILRKYETSNKSKSNIRLIGTTSSDNYKFDAKKWENKILKSKSDDQVLSVLRNQKPRIEVSSEITKLKSEEIFETNIKSLCYLVSDVVFRNSNNFVFIVSLDGDILFYNLNDLTAHLWHKNLNIPILYYFKINLELDGNDCLGIVNTDGIMKIIDCFGNILSIDLGEPIHSFSIGYFSFRNQVKIIQSNESLRSFSDESFEHQNEFDCVLNLAKGLNKLCIIFVSTLSSKLCVVPMDRLVANAIDFNTLSLKFKCLNIQNKDQNENETRNILYGNNLYLDDIDYSIR